MFTLFFGISDGKNKDCSFLLIRIALNMPDANLLMGTTNLSLNISDFVKNSY
jgi:hypothetical protein